MDFYIFLTRLSNIVVLYVMRNQLFNATTDDISAIHVMAHRSAGGLKSNLEQRSFSHVIDISKGFFNFTA